MIGKLIVLLEKQGTGIKIETAQEFIKTVLEFSPWFLQAGSFNIPDWEQVKADLQKALKELKRERVRRISHSNIFTMVFSQRHSTQW